MIYFEDFQLENPCVLGSPEASGPSGTTKRGNASFSSLFLGKSMDSWIVNFPAIAAPPANSCKKEVGGLTGNNGKTAHAVIVEVKNC